MGNPSQANQWVQPQALQLSIISSSHASPRPPRYADQAPRFPGASLWRGQRKVEQAETRRSRL